MTDNRSFISTLASFLQENWKKTGFSKPTNVQEKAVPLVLEGKDIVVESPTGTGKTLAYVLPLLTRIDPQKKDIQAVILAPSRELVMQIFQEIQKWSEGSEIIGASLIGGANIKNQVEKLKKRPHIIVGTPGRILELFKMKKLKMHEVKSVVLDEGDQLLVSEHRETVKNIIKATLNDRQLLFFSATLSSTVEQGAQEMMKEAELVRVKRDSLTSSKVEHIYFVCDKREKIDVLRRIVRMGSGSIKALGFVRDIGNLSVMGDKLRYQKLDMEILHSDSKKTERAKALNDFRQGKFPLLLATDVAARGLDIEALTHVIHVDLPKDVDQYVHRSGRTGRMGKTGTVISIVTPQEERELKRFGRKLGINIQQKTLHMGKMKDKK